jgi:hypothetical protein
LDQDASITECKLCGKRAKLVKAHIIPEAFYREVRGAQPGYLDTMMELPVSGSGYAKRRPVGPYDSQLVCRSCEELFQLWDEYAARILIHDFDSHFPIEAIDGRPRRVGRDLDYAKFKLFVISLLWRIAATNLDSLRGCPLGRTWQSPPTVFGAAIQGTRTCLPWRSRIGY